MLRRILSQWSKRLVRDIRKRSSNTQVLQQRCTLQNGSHLAFQQANRKAHQSTMSSRQDHFSCKYDIASTLEVTVHIAGWQRVWHTFDSRCNVVSSYELKQKNEKNNNLKSLLWRRTFLDWPHSTSRAYLGFTRRWQKSRQLLGRSMLHSQAWNGDSDSQWKVWGEEYWPRETDQYSIARLGSPQPFINRKWLKILNKYMIFFNRKKVKSNFVRWRMVVFYTYRIIITHHQRLWQESRQKKASVFITNFSLNFWAKSTTNCFTVAAYLHSMLARLCS